MSTGARGGGRGRGRGQGRGRGRGGAKTAASKDFVTTTVENNDSSLTTDAPQQKQQQKKNDVTMTEKKNNNTNNNNNNKPGKKKANNKPAAAPAPAAPAAPAPAPAPAKANNDKNNQKNRKRGRKEAENGDVPVVEANATASVNEDKPVEPPAKRQKTENGGYRKKFKRDENWTPGNEHIKGQTPLISVYNIPMDATVEEIEELVEEQVGVRPIKVRVIPRMSKQKKPSAQSQSGKVHVMFETPEQAVTAVEKLNGFTYKDKELKAQYTKEVKLTLNEDYRGISTALKLYEAYGSTVEDIISAIKKYCTNVPDNLHVRRLYTGGYDYGIVSIETGDVDIAQRMEKELKGKSIKDHVPLVGYWAQPWKKNQKPGKEQEQEQEQMQVDNE